MKGSEKYVIQYTCIVLCEMYSVKCGQIHNNGYGKIYRKCNWRASEASEVLFSHVYGNSRYSRSKLQLSPLASFVLYSFSSKRVLDYVSSQHGTNQYWFIINKKIQHFLLGKLARLVMGTIF